MARPVVRSHASSSAVHSTHLDEENERLMAFHDRIKKPPQARCIFDASLLDKVA